MVHHCVTSLQHIQQGQVSEALSGPQAPSNEGMAAWLPLVEQCKQAESRRGKFFRGSLFDSL